jgi:hypothetical protein
MVTKGPDGYLGSLTTVQEKTMKEFKAEVQKRSVETWKYDLSPFDDYDFLRFLRARKFDLKKSLEMFDNYIRWRIDFGVDKIFVGLSHNSQMLDVQIPGKTTREGYLSSWLPQD